MWCENVWWGWESTNVFRLSTSSPHVSVCIFKEWELSFSFKAFLNHCYSLCPWQYHVTIAAAHWSNHFFKENFPSSKKRSYIIGLLFPAYHCCSSQMNTDLNDISSRSRETTFSHEDHRFQLSSVNLPCLRVIIVLSQFTGLTVGLFSWDLSGPHSAVVGRTLIWASWCGPVCCEDIHSDSCPGCSWGWTNGTNKKNLMM